MGNFLIVIANPGFEQRGETAFRKGLQVAGDLWNQQTAGTLALRNIWAAGFSRWNGSGGGICEDKESGDWLISIGTWIHSDDFGPNDQLRLLRNIRNKGPLRVAQDLEGFFVLAGTTDRRDEIFVLTDIIGSCHVFLRAWNGITALSGSSLLLAALAQSKIDLVATQEFLYSGIIYEDRTLFAEVHKLDPATCFTFRNGSLVEKSRYWSIASLKPESIDDSAAVGILKETVQATARRISKLYSNLLCDLTGGYDSRTLVAGFLSAGIPVSTTVSGPANSPDAYVSAELAKLAGLDHQRSDPEPIHLYEQIQFALTLTDGEYDLTEYARICEIHRSHAKRLDISLNGSFGEVGRGYWWEILFPRTGACEALNSGKVARLRYMPKSFDSTLIPRNQVLDLPEHYAALIGRNNAGLESCPNTFQLDNAYLGLRMQRWQGRIASSTNRIWPCISPFMFRSLLEIMLQTSSRLRQRSLLIRKLLPELNKRFAEYPLERGYPPLSVSIRTLHRFWPLIPLYSAKALKRFRYLGSRRRISPKQESTPIRTLLQRDPQIRHVLQPQNMLLSEVFDGEKLADFIQRAQAEYFTYESEWARVLTLECTLRYLRHVSMLLTADAKSGKI